MKNIEVITSRILGEAEEYRQGLLADADKEISLLKKEYAAKRIAFAEKKQEETAGEIEERQSRAVSSAEVAKRNIILAEKARLLDEAYAKAVSTLLSLPEKDYLAFLSGLLADAIDGLCENEKLRAEHGSEKEFAACDTLELILNEKDRKAIGNELLAFGSEKAKTIGKSMVLSEKTAQIGGGFLLRVGEVETNCDLNQLVESVRPQTEQAVYAALFEA